MRVLLADDHAILRQGLRSLLAREAGVEIIGEAADGREAVELTEKLRPEVIVMDISMPLLNGLEATRQIRTRFPWVKVIVLSVHEQDSFVIRALQFGANAYILKKGVFSELKLALKAVIKGEYFLSPSISRVVVEQLFRPFCTAAHFSLYDNLTFREREVLQLLAEKRGRREIAALLSISPKTVDKHRENIREKLGIKAEEEILVFAKLIGLSSP